MVNWWDQVYVTLQIAFPGIWGLLPSVGSTAYDLAQSTFLALFHGFGGILVVAMYFPISMLHVVIQLLNNIIGSLAGVMNAIIDVGNSLTGMFTSTFAGVFPSAWVAILGTILTINIALRVYYFAKDISILGFKI
jgi:hypothetical protein